MSNYFVRREDRIKDVESIASNSKSRSEFEFKINREIDNNGGVNLYSRFYTTWHSSFWSIFEEYTKARW